MNDFHGDEAKKKIQNGQLKKAEFFKIANFQKNFREKCMYVSLLYLCLNFAAQICFWQQVRFKHKYERKKQVVTVAEKRYEKTTLGTKLPGLNLFLYILILLNL